MGYFASIIALIGRICMAAIFVISGLEKVFFWDQTLAFMSAHGMFMLVQLLLFLATVIEIFGGIGLILGWFFRCASTILALYLIPVTFVFHAFWALVAPGDVLLQQTMFLKNLAIFGGLLALAAAGPGRISI